MLDVPNQFKKEEYCVLLDYVKEMLIFFETEKVDMTMSTTGIPLTKTSFIILKNKLENLIE